MKIISWACCGGLAALALGLTLEHFEIKGLSYGSGYVHLRWLDSLFYALHSKDNVIMMVGTCHFLLGALFGGAAGLLASTGPSESDRS